MSLVKGDISIEIDADVAADDFKLDLKDDELAAGGRSPSEHGRHGRLKRMLLKGRRDGGVSLGLERLEAERVRDGRWRFPTKTDWSGRSTWGRRGARGLMGGSD